MKKKFIAAILTGTLIIGMLSGCGNSSQETVETTAQTEETSVETTEQEAEGEEEEEADTSYYEDGRAYLYGLDGKEFDYEAAYTNFEKAVEEGKTEANFYLGALYYYYEYPEKDYQKAKSYFEAAGDNPYAQGFLGELYYLGNGVEEDKIKGQELIDTAIEQGYREGYMIKGDIARSENDYDTSFECYNKALESEEQLFVAITMYNIGYLCKNGQGVEQDYAQAMECYQKSSDLGNSNAMSQIGYMYHNGQGVEQDYTKALEWYEKAANLGNSVAISNIGYLYENGQGVEQDYAKAMECYEKSADLGYSLAMSNIGWLYENGLGVEQDYVKALEWYEKAADLGNSGAISAVGYFYENGLGVEQDSVKAQEWYDKAEAIKNGGSTNIEEKANAEDEYASLEEAFSDPEVKAEIDEMISSLEDDGMSVSYEVSDNNFLVIYQILNVTIDDYDGLAESMEDAMSQLDGMFKALAKSFDEVIGEVGDCTVTVRCLDASDNVLFDKTYSAE